jgi:hypothetical protein
VEAVLDEAAPGGVKDLTAPGIQVFLCDAWHAHHYRTNIRFDKFAGKR